MRLALVILSIPVTFTAILSQTAVKVDSAVYTFTIQSDGLDEICNSAAIGKKFKVLKSDFKLPVYSVYILYNKISKTLKEDKTYTVKGHIWSQKEWVYGCGSSRREEIRFYVDPAYFVLYLKPVTD